MLECIQIDGVGLMVWLQLYIKLESHTSRECINEYDRLKGCPNCRCSNLNHALSAEYFLWVIILVRFSCLFYYLLVVSFYHFFSLTLNIHLPLARHNFLVRLDFQIYCHWQELTVRLARQIFFFYCWKWIFKVKSHSFRLVINFCLVTPARNVLGSIISRVIDDWSLTAHTALIILSRSYVYPSLAKTWFQKNSKEIGQLTSLVNISWHIRLSWYATTLLWLATEVQVKWFVFRSFSALASRLEIYTSLTVTSVDIVSWCVSEIDAVSFMVRSLGIFVSELGIIASFAEIPVDIFAWCDAEVDII